MGDRWSRRGRLFPKKNPLPPSFDVTRSDSKRIDRIQEEEKVEKKEKPLEEKLQRSLSLFRKYLELKNEKPANWQPPDRALHEILQQMHHEHLEKINQVEQLLPKILAKEPSKARDTIIEKAQNLEEFDFRGQPLFPNMYDKIDELYEDIQKLFPNDSESSSSRGSGAVGQDRTSS